MRWSSTRPSSPAPKAGSTSTTTAPSWPANSASSPTASRPTTPPRSTRTTIRSWPRSPRTSAPPTCRSARSASRSNCTRRRSAVIFNYTPYPNAAKAYLQFMFEEPQMNDWIKQSAGYCCQTLKAFANNPIWTRRSEQRRLCQGVGDAASERLCRPARLRLGRHHGRLRAGRHVRQGRHRPGDAAGGDGRRREARQPLLPGLGAISSRLTRLRRSAAGAGDRLALVGACPAEKTDRHGH